MREKASGQIGSRCTRGQQSPVIGREDPAPGPGTLGHAAIGKARKARPDARKPTTDKLARLLDQGLTSQYFAEQDAPEIDWIVDGVLESSATAMIYGDSGIGKTFLSMHLAYCIGAGKSWFNHKCQQCRVLYLDGENGTGLLHNRSKLIDVAGEADITYFPFPDLALDDSGQRLLIELIDSTDADAVMIDPLMTFMKGDENSIQDIRPQIRGLREIAESQDCALALIHHENRSGGYRGSSGFKDLVTLQLHIKKSKTKVDGFTHVLDAIPKKQRQSTLGRFTLAWKVVDGRFKAGCIAGMEDGPVQKIVEACAKVHSESGKWPGKDELIKAKDIHGLSQNAARKALTSALQEDRITEHVGAHNKHEYRCVHGSS